MPCFGFPDNYHLVLPFQTPEVALGGSAKHDAPVDQQHPIDRFPPAMWRKYFQ
jgi:hypothetical protein